MWPRGVNLVVWAATGTPSSETDQLVIILGGIIVAAITAGGTVLVAFVNTRVSRTSPSPPAPAGNALDDSEVRRRLDDSDERDEMQDRRHERYERDMDRIDGRIERIEDHLDRTDPGWRRAP